VPVILASFSLLGRGEVCWLLVGAGGQCSSHSVWYIPSPTCVLPLRFRHACPALCGDILCLPLGEGPSRQRGGDLVGFYGLTVPSPTLCAEVPTFLIFPPMPPTTSMCGKGPHSLVHTGRFMPIATDPHLLWYRHLPPALLYTTYSLQWTMALLVLHKYNTMEDVSSQHLALKKMAHILVMTTK